jgi:predicted transposase/invertase (TIGR01784 family)
MDILSPKTDAIFKLLFGDKRNIDILVDFLKSVLDLEEDEYTDITIGDPYLKPENIDDKFGILDVKLQTGNGS